MTEASAEGSAILDCVITVPAFWGPAQRQAMLDAAKIAGMIYPQPYSSPAIYLTLFLMFHFNQMCSIYLQSKSRASH